MRFIKCYGKIKRKAFTADCADRPGGPRCPRARSKRRKKTVKGIPNEERQRLGALLDHEG